ncbi:MAG: hypothetical protein H5T62_17745, partial [Anaerolineae bacterium]|nr:hypothetical protein [Anaerolineae bacterium]
VSGGVAGGVGYGVRSWRTPATPNPNPNANANPNALGRAGEEAAGITGPKTRIDSIINPGKFRVPDEVDRVAGIVREVKNVTRLSYTSQLRDYALWAQREGYTFELITRQGTQLSGPLRAAIERGEIIWSHLPW